MRVQVPPTACLKILEVIPRSFFVNASLPRVARDKKCCMNDLLSLSGKSPVTTYCTCNRSGGWGFFFEKMNGAFFLMRNMYKENNYTL